MSGLTHCNVNEWPHDVFDTLFFVEFLTIMGTAQMPD